MKAVITSSPLALTSSVGLLLTPADFPFFNDCTAASTSLQRTGRGGGVVLCVCLGTVQYKQISVSLVIIHLRAVFYPSVQYLLFFCEAFSRTILESISFPLFHCGQDSHSRAGMPSYRCSSSDFLQSHCTVLLSSFLLPFSSTSKRCCSQPNISQILQVQICFFSAA